MPSYEVMFEITRRSIVKIPDAPNAKTAEYLARPWANSERSQFVEREDFPYVKVLKTIEVAPGSSEDFPS